MAFLEKLYNINEGVKRMKIELRERTADHVRIYFQKASDPQIRELLPQSAQTVEEALEDYARSVSPGSASYGRTISADDT